MALKVRLKLSARSRQSSMCCCWSSPTGTCVALPEQLIERSYRILQGNAPICKNVSRLQDGVREKPGVQQRLIHFRVIPRIPRRGKSGLEGYRSWNVPHEEHTLTFHVVIRLSLPIGVIQLSIQASSAWCGFSSWWKMTDRSGLSPTASNTASMSLRATLRALGSCGSVSACHPTIE